MIYTGCTSLKLFLWFSLAQSVKSRNIIFSVGCIGHHHVRVQPGAECTKIANFMRMRIDQARVVPNVGCNKPFHPGSPGSDLNTVIRTDCLRFVKRAEAVWNYKSGRHSAL